MCRFSICFIFGVGDAIFFCLRPLNLQPLNASDKDSVFLSMLKAFGVNLAEWRPVAKPPAAAKDCLGPLGGYLWTLRFKLRLV